MLVYLRYIYHIYICIYSHPIYYPRTTLVPPLSSNSNPGSHGVPFSPLPITVRVFMFIARIIQHFLPSWTRVKLYLLTLLGAHSS